MKKTILVKQAQLGGLEACGGGLMLCANVTEIVLLFQSLGMEYIRAENV